MSLLIHLAQVPDFRRAGGNFRYPLLSILVIRALALLDLPGGALVGLAARGAQPAIAEQLVDQGGHYLLALKRNQAGLWAEIERAFERVTPQRTATGWASHNMPVRWQMTRRADLRWVDEAGRWPALAALVRKTVLNLLRADPRRVSLT